MYLHLYKVKCFFLIGTSYYFQYSFSTKNKQKKLSSRILDKLKTTIVGTLIMIPTRDGKNQ